MIKFVVKPTDRGWAIYQDAARQVASLGPLLPQSRAAKAPSAKTALDRCCRKSRPRDPWGIGWRFDLASVGLIGVSGFALAGAASTLMPPIDARNSRAGVLWWRPDEAQG